MSKVVIHRDRTFTYRGEQWRILGAGPGQYGAESGYYLQRDSDMHEIDGFLSMAEIREYVNRAAENGWPLEDDAP